MALQADGQLNQTFGALSDPTRRALLGRLGKGEEISVGELARPFDMSLPAIMKHLDVLERAGLLARTKTGRTVHCRLIASPMEDAMRWLARYERFWQRQLDALARFVEGKVEGDTWQPQTRSRTKPASPSGGKSRLRPRRSSKP